MSSQSNRKTPWSLRFATMRVNYFLGANMKLWQYDNFELLHAAEMAFWMNDHKFAGYVMEELAKRIVEEHPPDGERLEIEVEEISEETGPAYERTAKPVEYEIDDDSFCYDRGRE